MKKRTMIITLAIALTLVFGSTAFAKPKEAPLSDELVSVKTMDAIEKANDKIDSTIDKAVDKADDIVAKDGDASSTIDKLIAKTDKTALKMIDKAAEDGVVVTAEYVPVEIGGQTVMVDPIRVYNR